jgi:PleD family two-component response regulator
MNQELSSDLFPPVPLTEREAMVFLVDDQPMVGEAVRRALKDEEDISLHYCADYANAVRHATELRPTVILQDLVMPNIDGLHTVEAYRLNPDTKDIPIIVLSTKEDPRIKSAAFAAGANDYLVKLPDRIELIARIRYHSRAHIHRVQRDEAYHALRESQRLLAERVQELELALAEVKTLRGMLPICCYCKKIRDTSDYWQDVEQYMDQHAEVSFSHCICPECLDRALSEMTQAPAGKEAQD